MSCKYYLPWTITYSIGAGQSEIDDVCINEDKRTIRKCPFRREKQCECPDYKPSEWK